MNSNHTIEVIPDGQFHDAQSLVGRQLLPTASVPTPTHHLHFVIDGTVVLETRVDFEPVHCVQTVTTLLIVIVIIFIIDQ